MLPTTYFTQKPFPELDPARGPGCSAALLLHVDYRLPVDPVRAELRRILEDSPLWDRRDWVVQVVDTTPTTMVLRALMSSPDAPTSWDLRCEVREKLVAFLAREYPHRLPRLRTELDPAPAPVDGHPRPGPTSSR